MAEQLSTSGSTSSGYTQNVLSTPVGVLVTAASKTITLEQVLSLTPGSVLGFDQRFDQPLSLDLSGCVIASGSVVKVGERLGLRVSAAPKS